MTTSHTGQATSTAHGAPSPSPPPPPPPAFSGAARFRWGGDRFANTSLGCTHLRSTRVHVEMLVKDSARAAPLGSRSRQSAASTWWKRAGGQHVCRCPSSGIGTKGMGGVGRTSIFVQALVHPAVERVIGPAWFQRPEPKHGADRELVQVGHHAARCCGRLGVQRRRWWRPGPGPGPLGRRSMITHHGAAPAPQAFIRGLSQAFCRRPRRRSKLGGALS